MTRRVLLVGAVAWLLVGIVGIGLAVFGRAWLLTQLPPLAIDADALGGAVTAMALLVAGIGGAQLGVLVGLGRGWRWVWSAGALLASVLAALLLGLAATAISSALREAAYAAPLIGAACLAVCGMLAYSLVAVRLVRELGSGPAA